MDTRWQLQDVSGLYRVYHRTELLFLRPGRRLWDCYIAMPHVAQLKCFQPGQTWSIQFRPFGGGKAPTEAEVKETLLYVLRCFDKINPEQVCKQLFNSYSNILVHH